MGGGGEKGGGGDEGGGEAGGDEDTGGGGDGGGVGNSGERGDAEGGGGDGGGVGDPGERASLELEPLEARSTGSHCGGQTTGRSTSASLPATQGFVVFGLKAAQKAVLTTQMRTSARELEACFFAYRC